MSTLLRILVSAPGRVMRIVAGVTLIIFGLFFTGSAIGYLVAVAGLVMFAVAAGDVCIFAPLCGLPPEGKQTRAQLHK